LKEYEEELKKLLLDITPNVQTYFGELSDFNNIQVATNKMLIIYVDFIGEKPINDFSTSMQFCLYLVIATFSKNEKVRDTKRYDIYTLINGSFFIFTYDKMAIKYYIIGY